MKPTSPLISQYKSKTRLTQLQTIFAYLQLHIATASMVSEATGIPQKCITRYKRDLEKNGRLWEVVKKHCEKTGFLAWYLTTNPKSVPSSSQLNLFDMPMKPDSDFEGHTIGAQDLKDEITKLQTSFDENEISENLKTVLATRDRIRKLKGTEVQFSEPILLQKDNPVIFPNTINVIQGQAGVHKSRVAEIICSALLKLDICENDLLGFKRVSKKVEHTVIYIDTERNISEQFPFALQSIQRNAGYKLEDSPLNFDFVSLLQVNRKERFDVLQEYLNIVKRKTSNPLFIVLDVSTDCIEDFNKTDKSMELIDLMNIAINEYNVTFLCIIHENPKTDKARGHFGTELMNKASTVMQVGFEKDFNQNDTAILRLKYLKCRSSNRHEPFYFKFCNETKGLVLANEDEITESVNNRKHKAEVQQVVELIGTYLSETPSLARPELLERLRRDCKASDRTIETRISEIIKSNLPIEIETGQQFSLVKDTKSKVVYYSLTPISE